MGKAFLRIANSAPSTSSLSSSRGALKAEQLLQNQFHAIAESTLHWRLKTEAVGKAAAQQVENRFLLSCGAQSPRAQSDLTAVCRGQNDCRRCAVWIKVPGLAWV